MQIENSLLDSFNESLAIIEEGIQIIRETHPRVLELNPEFLKSYNEIQSTIQGFGDLSLDIQIEISLKAVSVLLEYRFICESLAELEHTSIFKQSQLLH